CARGGWYPYYYAMDYW
nr:immunoglobulin heavy chain junction region [Mus musculus]MBK4195716.1 immunoglobulin heavy chain junction region [Mus musculus]MBK4195717.1 immunoglobulin heavy chain junction region [Mus musculus]MBK4195718.1 immunoglobulin heavy chain junction region [Mus musculus]MBK4195719.1 immunoglobulin heavy chain junction region [Mus musculus]